MNAKKVAKYGMLVALAMVLSFLESMLPAFVAIPGVKLGLTNLVVMVALYMMGPADAFIINMVRIVLVGLSFGNGYSMIYSLAGGALSFLVMLILTRKPQKKSESAFSPVGVGAAGGVAHNMGQIIVAYLILKSGGVVFYMPVLVASGMVAGIVIGVLS